MGTKNNPGTYDCYANAQPDEPMFVLLGRDPLAADLVERWADRREETHGLSAKVEEARACARAMRAWVPRPLTTEEQRRATEASGASLARAMHGTTSETVMTRQAELPGDGQVKP